MKIRAYHGGSVPIKRFDRRFSAQGVFWFSEDVDKILRGESGASGVKYVMEVILTVDKVAGWAEYEPLGLDQIESMGFDSIRLDDDWIVFDSGRIKVVGTERVDGGGVQASEAGAVAEANDKDLGTWRGRSFWIAAFDLTDGEILEAHTYEEAADNDFHHSHYFSDRIARAIKDDDVGVFWFDNRGGITFWESTAALNKWKSSLRRQSGMAERGGTAGGRAMEDGPSLDDLYPLAGPVVSGLAVGDDVPNTSSISATLGDDYSVLPGIREVPLDNFKSSPEDLFYAANDIQRTKNLAAKIAEDGWIAPLIVGIDRKGPWIIEGAHRLGALHRLGVKTFPALVVVDESEDE